MPRPSSGYFNAAGQKIPGTNDIVRLWGNKYALMRWHNQQGLLGINTEEDNSAIDIGSVVHAAIERYMRGAQKAEIAYLFRERLAQEDHREAAYASFRAFLEWYEQCEVNPIEQETSLVSEAHQYGGTPDLIAHVRNRIAIVDFKTSKGATIYPEAKVALRAHASLWNEHNPKKFAIQAYHLIGLSKEGAGFKHYEYESLDSQWSLFLTLLEAYRLEKACGSVTQGRAKPAKAKAAEPKPATRVRAQSSLTLTELVEAADLANHVCRPEHQFSMAEILRAHGHVPEVRP
jgi:PD-(D/E)XK nuclease superfamily protein